MLKKLRQSNQGFTIIEVLIVLAIAALILLIVFLAVPALQRNSRNTSRQDEAARVSAAVTECMANRNGVIASCDTDAEIEQGGTTQLTALAISTNNTAPTANTTTAGVWYARVCNADGSAATTTGATPRSHVVIYQIEPTVDRCIGS